MPVGFPWGMPANFMPEGFAPTLASLPASSPVMSVPPPVVHMLPRVEDTIYHSEPSDGPDVYEKMNDMKDQFLELRKELKTLRGKDLFGKSAAELCLVPNVKIPIKFKVPDFEKYKGNTCPLSHLVMYARKISTQTDNDQLLIHYFQDSLSGAAVRWYMGLESSNIRSFNGLGEAFVKQYKYNVDMAPDRDHKEIWKLCKEEGGNCYPLKTKVQDLVRSGILFFEDVGPNVKKNPLPEHGKSVNMVQGFPGKYKVKYVSHIRQSLVELHRLLCDYSHYENDHDRCRVCYVNQRGCRQVRRDVQEMLDEGVIEILQNRNVDEDELEVNVISLVFRIPEPVVIKYDGSKQKVSPALTIKPAGPIPYSFEKAVPYRYNAVAVENGKEVSFPSSSVVNIADADTRGSIDADFVERPIGNAVSTLNPALVVKPSSTLKTPVSAGPNGNTREDCDEMLRLIKRSEYNVVDQLLQTPSKISVLSLLLNSEPHREALQKVLDVAYVDHDVTIEQFDSIVANITACNNLSFCVSDLPEEGRDHNLALHISMSCKDDAMSNVLVDTGSSLNVLPKTTLSKLSYQGPPMRQSGVVVKAFDGSRKTVIGEVDLPVKIGPSDFHITFQVMDIHPSYSCLLGRPWIHEAGAVTSTLHQKLKFVKSKKLVVVGGEKALLVSHLSSFSYIDAEDEVGTPFQALSIAEPVEKRTPSFASYKDAKLAIEHGATAELGQMIELEDNKSRAGIGYSSGVFNKQGLFKSGGFIHTAQDEEDDAILEEDEEDSGNFIIPGGICNNWVDVDIPTVVHKSKLIKPIEHNDPTPSPKFEFPVFEVEEDDVEEIPDEITCLLEHEEKIIQPHLENLETVNLGSADCVREVKIGALLEESVKKGLIELLREYVDVFAWSYEDMLGLDTDIVQHFLPLKPECVPVKQKLRRTHPDMAVKIKEEVQKQIDAGFLVTSTYPQWVANIVPMPKKDGKVRMCVDYRDLNKASPKDDFPLPHIDMLVDNTTKFKNGYTRGISLRYPADDRDSFSSTVGIWYLIPAKLVRALDSSILSRFSLLYSPKRVFQTIHSPVELTVSNSISLAELTVPDCILPSRSSCSSEFDARSMISMLDPWSLSLKQNLGTVSMFASLAESPLSQVMVAKTTVALLSSKLSVPFSPQSESRYFVIARTPRGRSFPHKVHGDVYLQQHCQGPEDGDLFPSRVPRLGLAFSLTQHFTSLHVESYCIASSQIA
ncbi:hypothetical protein KIW84_030655 [Lathyrus oleraceus]|uniref:Retrotransposon gag domain-containing protein n=1 Tax=Pisum sativum TaxID=3888 RepID=A0A9D4XNQ3_PEA|nr:hypothetical protein KIW84_030655 [Pisum sativum]